MAKMNTKNSKYCEDLEQLESLYIANIIINL